MTRAAALALILLGAALTVTAPAANRRKMPSIDEVEQFVESHFATESNYQPGDIISRSQVRAVLDDLQRQGWKVPRDQELLNLVLDDSDILVRELRTKDGRKFARQISRYPHAYDRIDRLARMPTGKSILWRSIHGAGGYQLLEYLTTAPGGTEMGKMLANTPSGRDFNKPTGRVYTAAGLIQQLRPRYEETWAAVTRAQAKALQLNPNRP